MGMNESREEIGAKILKYEAVLNHDKTITPEVRTAFEGRLLRLRSQFKSMTIEARV